MICQATTSSQDDIPAEYAETTLKDRTECVTHLVPNRKDEDCFGQSGRVSNRLTHTLYGNSDARSNQNAVFGKLTGGISNEKMW